MMKIKFLGKLKVQFMGNTVKHITSAVMILLIGMSYANTTLASGDEKNSGQDSFAHIENLDRNIEEAGKEISALKLDSQLNALRQKAQKMSIDFAILKIYGIENMLIAVFQFENHNILEVKSGDMIEGRYKVVSISSNNVLLYDNKKQKTFIAPFI